jgi:hypothetical protein
MISAAFDAVPKRDLNQLLARHQKSAPGFTFAAAGTPNLSLMTSLSVRSEIPN